MSFGQGAGAVGGAYLGAIVATIATGGTAGPLVLALASAAGASTAMSAGSQIYQAKTQSKIMEYNARVAEQNAIAAKQQAEYEANKLRRQREKMLGRQRALYASSGVQFEGSPLLALADTAAEYEMDILATQRTGLVNAQQYQSEAALQRAKAVSTRTTGVLNAGTTILTGAADILKSTKKG